MTNNTDSVNTTAGTDTWQLNALTEALGDLTLTVNDSLSVGRGSDNDVVLGSKQVSRNHAVLSVLDGQLYVKDLDSSNGTFVNDQRITGNESNLLQAEDTLGFASFSFQVQASATLEEDTTVVPAASEESVSRTDDEAASMEVTKPAYDEYIIEDHIGNEPVVKQTCIDEVLTTKEDAQESSAIVNPADSSSIAESKDKTPVTEVTEIEASTSETPSTQAVAVEEKQPVVNESIAEEAVAEEPVTKETGIDDVLRAADNAELDNTAIDTQTPSDKPVLTGTEHNTMTTDTTETTKKAPTNNEPLAAHKEPVRDEPVRDEHDKTTKTELQEEVDPEVLEAKQAATAQFSGTANLGQSRDLGTQGNNAMDQEISNPAHKDRVEKKSSGGWFIWVFIAILIIGLALWLFNMGGM